MKDQAETTAADEAAEIQKNRRQMMLVTCALPQGIVLNNHLDKDGNPTSAPNFGPGTPISVKGSDLVDKAFWDAWALYNGDFVDRGVVTAIPEREQAENEALDGENDVGREGPDGPEQDL